MYILFITIGLPNMSTEGGGLYADMIHELVKSKHEVVAIAPSLQNQETGLSQEGSVNVLRVAVPFLKRNTSLLRKGIGSLMIKPFYVKAYKDYLSEAKFDYILLPTPPPTLVDVVKEMREKTNAKLYLILRDIQPECADRSNINPAILERDDIYEECKKPFKINRFVRSFLYRKSQKLYMESDVIGCMSPANMTFVKQIAPFVDERRITLLPNWYKDPSVAISVDNNIREKYGLQGKFVAIFGGNIGPQQAVWNIASLAKHYKGNSNIAFLVVGRGAKMATLREIANRDKLENIIFISYLPRNEYEQILRIADVGIISLDEKYIVPTCPSKVIGYMALSQPVLAMINEGSDYGEFYIDKPGCGLWSAGLDNEKMFSNFEWMYTHPVERKAMGEAGYRYFKEHFAVDVVCKELCKQLENG